ncbi:MAG: right-handed parallel beta-helix repeat-containing protein [Myxococcota bacterium]
MRSIPALALLSTLLAPPAFAGDGVLEINQACAVLTGCFPGDAAGFPVTINGNAGRSYRLTGDLIVPNASTTGIEISSDDVGIDLNNFSIRGPAVCSGTPLTCTPIGVGVGISAGLQTGISVRDGAVRGMGSYGVLLGGQAQVSGVRARSNGLSGIYVGVGSTVIGNAAYQNGGDGISSIDGSVISGNTAYLNRFIGIFAANGATVSGNSAYRNGTHGIGAGAGATVSEEFDLPEPRQRDPIRASGAIVVGNSTRFNTGFGLNLGTQSGYRENAISSNFAGTVTGTSFVNLGNNICNGSIACP